MLNILRNAILVHSEVHVHMNIMITLPYILYF